MTNLNRIRAMTKAELAAFLERVHADPCRTCCGHLGRCMLNNAWEPVCRRHFEEWLREEQEVRDLHQKYLEEKNDDGLDIP